jgi:uncharacterized protein
MKRLALLLLAVLSVFSPAFAEKVASMPAPTGYIDDYAGVMTTDGRAQVDRICHEIHLKTKAQIFVVTIRTLDGETIQTFSNDLYHQWKIGEKKTDRGVLLLLAVSEHKWRIEVGYGLEGVLNDAKVGRIGRDMVPSLKASDYDAAARIAVQELAEDIAADANVTLDQPVAALPPAAAAAPATREGGTSLLGALPFLLFFGIFGLILFFNIRRRRMMRSGLYYNEPPVQPGIFYTGSTFDSPGNDRFGSSDSSNSFSSSDSSSSDSFSGGDGGDSGGGGADGGW